MKGIHCDIYRNHYGDCTNGGITASGNGIGSVTLIGPDVEGFCEPTEAAPALYLSRGPLGHCRATPEPLSDGRQDGSRWWMFGGNFIHSSDSRFAALNNGAPIAVHDRTETKDGGGQ